jgi:hypothetical protein
MKKIQVQMQDVCHAALKDYANAWGMTMSEVMYEATRCFMHKHSENCGYIQSLFTFRRIKADKRLTKACYGPSCFACEHLVACKTGRYTGDWEMSEKVAAFIDFQD